MRFLSVIGSFFVVVSLSATYNLWSDFVDPQERIRELSQLIASLPIANYSLLRALTAHLLNIVQHASINKMTMRNVGIVFSPTLGIPAGVFSLMLQEFNRVFNVDGEGDVDGEPAPELQQPAVVESQTHLRTPRPSEDGVDLRRNSQHYHETSADQMLGLSGRGQMSCMFSSPLQISRLMFVCFLAQPEESDSETDESLSSGRDQDSSSIASSEVDIEVGAPSPGVGDNVASPPDTPRTPRTKPNGSLFVEKSDRGNRHSKMLGLPSRYDLSNALNIEREVAHT